MPLSSTPFQTANAVDNTGLHGVIYAPKNPRAVMTLVHGFGEHQGRYAGMAEHLNAAGIAVVTMDLRGHGISDSKRGVCKDYALMLGDISAQLAKTREAFPNLPTVLYGHSMGGGLVLRYISKAENREKLVGAIASAPLIELPKAIPAVQVALIKFLRKVAPNLSIGSPISGDMVSTMAAEQALYEADTLNHTKLGVGLAQDMVENGDIVLARAAKIDLPLLLLHAQDDRLTGPEGSRKFAELAPNCDLHILQDCQHEMHNDITRDAVYAMMIDFITQHA